MEERLEAFETALGRLFPGGDLDVTLQSLLQDEAQPAETGPSISPKRPPKVKVEDDAEAAEAAPEALPQQADGFDWAEKEISLGDLADGMAALSIKPEGAGYFGMLGLSFQN